MRLLRPGVSLLWLAAALWAAPAAVMADDRDVPVVRIGLSAPLSAPEFAAIGPAARDGAQMAIDDLNARGVRIGDRAVRLELLPVDDHADPQAAPDTVRALAAAGVAGVVGPLNSGIALRAASLYAQAGLPMITPSATHPGLTRLGLPNVFRLQPDDSVLVQRLLAWAMRERHLRRVTLVTEASGYGQVMSVLFRQAAQQAGLKIDDEVKLAAGQTDFGAAARRIEMARSDAVMAATLDGNGAALYRELHAHGQALTMIGGDGFCSAAFARLAGSVRRGEVLCARPGQHAPEPSPALAAFTQRYTERFGHAPNAEDDLAPYAYEATRVLVAAMVKAGSSRPAATLSHVRETTLADSLVGPFHFDAQGDVPDGAIALFTYDDVARVYMQPLP